MVDDDPTHWHRVLIRNRASILNAPKSGIDEGDTRTYGERGDNGARSAMKSWYASSTFRTSGSGKSPRTAL